MNMDLQDKKTLAIYNRVFFLFLKKNMKKLLLFITILLFVTINQSAKADDAYEKRVNQDVAKLKNAIKKQAAKEIKNTKNKQEKDDLQLFVDYFLMGIDIGAQKDIAKHKQQKKQLAQEQLKKKQQLTPKQMMYFVTHVLIRENGAFEKASKKKIDNLRIYWHDQENKYRGIGGIIDFDPDFITYGFMGRYKDEDEDTLLGPQWLVEQKAKEKEQEKIWGPCPYALYSYPRSKCRYQDMDPEEKEKSLAYKKKIDDEKEIWRKVEKQKTKECTQREGELCTSFYMKNDPDVVELANKFRKEQEERNKNLNIENKTN